ncbi:hypothetical protein ABW20_dc0105892 [Dactylellina cionopaga]|nr:hypothetical protein ABW20_dc0105892 [Dactylellina cionopaga]
MAQVRPTDGSDLPETVPSSLPQTYYFDHNLPEVVEPKPVPVTKYQHPQFSSTYSYTPSPPLAPPLEDRRILGLRRSTFFLSLALAVLIIFGVALGAGLGVGLKKNSDNTTSSNSSGSELSSTSSSPSSSSSSLPTSSPTSTTSTSTSTQCNPSRTPAVTNGDFEAGTESADIRPWYIVDLNAPATYEILNVNGSNVFHAICNSDLEHGAYTKIKLAQELNTCPNTTYDITFQHNFVPGNNQNAWLVVFIDGVEIGSIRAGPSNWVAFNGNFTSKPGGENATLLQLDFAPVDFDSQEFYVDDFQITPR